MTSVAPHLDWPPIAPALSLRGVGKRFGSRRVLDELSLDLAAGSFVAVVGRSGCGKTTLLRLIAGLERPGAGEVRLGDGFSAGDVRMVFQEPRLLPWRTVADNVALGARALPPGQRGRAVREALAQVGLEGRDREWPAVLSGGQRARVALARALVSRPRLLLLDEPLGALDALTRREMQGLIERVWREVGCAAVLVTHDVDEAVLLADRVIALDAGRVALDLPVPLPRPRAHRPAEVALLVSRVLDHLLGELGPRRSEDISGAAR